MRPEGKARQNHSIGANTALNNGMWTWKKLIRTVAPTSRGTTRFTPTWSLGSAIAAPARELSAKRDPATVVFASVNDALPRPVSTVWPA